MVIIAICPTLVPVVKSIKTPSNALEVFPFSSPPRPPTHELHLIASHSLAGTASLRLSWNSRFPFDLPFLNFSSLLFLNFSNPFKLLQAIGSILVRAQPTIDVLLRIGKLGSSLCYGLPVSVFLATNLNSLPIESQFDPALARKILTRGNHPSQTLRNVTSTTGRLSYPYAFPLSFDSHANVLG